MTAAERRFVARLAMRLRRTVTRLPPDGDYDMEATGDRLYYSSFVHRRLACENRALAITERKALCGID